MIKTPLGQIEVKKNGTIIPYKPFPLTQKSKYFSVEGRYGFILESLPPKTKLSVTVATPEVEKIKMDIEPGEQLSVISLETNSVKVSIGTTGEIPGMDYQYLENGLSLCADTFFEKLLIVVAWKYLVSAEDGINTWFAVHHELIGIEGSGKHRSSF